MKTAEARKRTAKKVSYYELLVFIRQYIDKKYGSVSQFYESSDWTKCGFKKTALEKAKIQNYLSLPKDGEDKKVVSVPAMTKLFKGLFNIELSSTTVMQKEVTILISEDLTSLTKRFIK
jgi:hypothetical protein